MSGNRNLRALLVIPLMGLLAVAVVSADAADAQGPGADFATMSVQGGNVSFASRISADSMTLRVAGNGFSTTRSFAGSIAFAPVDSKGYQLADGTYNWEIVVNPSVSRLGGKAYGPGKVSADGRTTEAASMPHGDRQSGVFTIKNGILVNPNLVEAQSARGDAAGSTRYSAPSAAARSAERVDADG